MKKVLFATAALTLVSFISEANPVNLHNKSDKEARKLVRKEKREQRKEAWQHSVNALTEIQFNDDFPDAKDVSWDEAAFSEATFYDAGIVKTAYYDWDHKLVGTTTKVDFSVLPEKAKRYIDKEYPGYKVRRVILFDDNEANNTDMYLFNNSFADEDNYFPVLTKGSKEIILKVTMDGDVSFFQNYK